MNAKKSFSMGVLAGFGLITSVALAQDDEGPPIEVGAATLEESRSTGHGIRIGGGRVRQVPDRVRVRPGDTLWDITTQYYGNPDQWPRVWSYNPEITNPHWIYPEGEVRLRPPEGPEGATADRPASASAARGLARRSPRARRPGLWLRQLAFLDRDALEEAGTIAATPEDHMLLSVYDRAYVRFGTPQTVESGDQLTIFRRHDAAQADPKAKGIVVRIFGTLQVTDYDPEKRLARTVITEALDPIERGFLVARVPRDFQWVPRKAATRDLEAEVVAALRPRELSGEQQLVFMDRGARHGIELGNRVFVVRRGDPWRRDLPTTPREAGSEVDELPAAPTPYPKEDVAEARVVNVRPSTAGLFIVSSRRPVRIGDRLELRRGQ